MILLLDVTVKSAASEITLKGHCSCRRQRRIWLCGVGENVWGGGRGRQRKDTRHVSRDTPDVAGRGSAGGDGGRRKKDGGERTDTQRWTE